MRDISFRDLNFDYFSLIFVCKFVCSLYLGINLSFNPKSKEIYKKNTPI